VARFGADPRLQFYVAPLGPFLNPGSRELKHRAGLIDDASHAMVRRHLRLAHAALAVIEETKGAAVTTDAGDSTTSPPHEDLAATLLRCSALSGDPAG
jgi:hypothetical protein